MLLSDVTMKKENIYVKDVAQISIQKPLCEEWMLSPMLYNEPYVRAQDPNFKEFVTSLESRRLGKILKRAIATSLTVVKGSGIAVPDAIITGTGMGCIENTEHFLSALCNEGEQFLKPTHFMQSTHNTISSLIGIYLKCNGYNATDSHRGISFDSALLDAVMQMERGSIKSALVGAHDEMSPTYYSFMNKSGYVDGEHEICSEAAVSVMLSTDVANAVARICGVELMYRPTEQMLRYNFKRLLDSAGIDASQLDGVVLGVSGNPAKDDCYSVALKQLFGNEAGSREKGLPLLRYKNIFGEGFSSSALGFYAAVCCIKNGYIPKAMYAGRYVGSGMLSNVLDGVNDKDMDNDGVCRLLLVNMAEGRDCALIILEKVCGK